MKTPAWKTVGDMLADPAIQEMTERHLVERARKERELEQIEEPLVRALAEVGCTVKTVYDIINTKRANAPVMRVLLDHFNRDYPDSIRLGIAHALNGPEAKNFWKEISAAYRRTPNSTPSGGKDGLAFVLGTHVDVDHLEEVISLMRDPRNGDSRIMFLPGLAKSKDDRARKALEDACNDPVLAKEAKFQLRLLKSKEARRKKSKA